MRGIGSRDDVSKLGGGLGAGLGLDLASDAQGHGAEEWLLPALRQDLQQVLTSQLPDLVILCGRSLT